MICPNCHGNIVGKHVTCPMCNYVLDYDALDINENFDEVSRFRFLFRYRIMYWLKILFLLFIIILTLSLVIIYSWNSLDKINYLIPILIIGVCISLIVIIVRGRRIWK